MITGNEPINAIFYGLTIRQHFAAMAMQGFIKAGLSDNNHKIMEECAKRSVMYANALIAELNKP